MADATVRFFPVGNGDCTLLQVGDTRVLIDFSPRLRSGDAHYDVEDMRRGLLPLLRRPDGRHVVDAFLITHPDKDHVLDAGEVLHLGPPSDYDASGGKAFIDEIIYVPASFEASSSELSKDAKLVLAEIERRLQSDSSSGNMVSALIGPRGTDPGADRIFSAGDVITRFGTLGSDARLSGMVYAPRGVLDPKDRNDVSGVVQFRITPTGTVNPVRVVIGGDAPHEVWEDIYRSGDLDDFRYDLFLAPHHCSWSAFGDSSEEDPSEEVVQLFSTCQEDAKVVASSYFIDIELTPPHPKAAGIYKEIVGASNFYCTGEYPSRDELQPIIFEITGYGIAELPPDEPSPGDSSAKAAPFIRRTPQKYG